MADRDISEIGRRTKTETSYAEMHRRTWCHPQKRGVGENRVSWLSRLFVKKRPEKATPAGAPKKTTKTYPAVELVAGPDGACAAARASSGKRLLISEAPLIPVPGCDRPRCGCSYRKYSDRRSQTRRASSLDMSALSDSPEDAGQDRRTRKGRRRTDAGRP